MKVEGVSIDVVKNKLNRLCEEKWKNKVDRVMEKKLGKLWDNNGGNLNTNK
jgi:hypothetical protein